MNGRVLNIETQAPALAYVYAGDTLVAATAGDGTWNADLFLPARLRFEGVGLKTFEANYLTADQLDPVYLEPSSTELAPVVVTRDDAAQAGLPWWLIALFVAAALASHAPRRR